MSEVSILPEMLQAGVEAMAESRARKLDDVNTAVAVYLAMSAIWEMYQQNEEKVIH